MSGGFGILACSQGLLEGELGGGLGEVDLALVAGVRNRVEGASKKLCTVVVWNGWLRTSLPAELVITISPVTPSPSWRRVMTFSSPSAAACTATWVPRMPMVATGVRTVIASEPVLAMAPETKVKTPCTTENDDSPVWVDGS